MKLLSSSIVFVLSLSYLLSSCNKTNHETSTSNVTGTMNINLGDAPTSAGEEVIISETGGTILLDTLSPFNGSLVASLKTNQTLVDVTFIGYDSIAAKYVVTTFKAVDPSLWPTMTVTSYWTPVSSLPSTQASIFYKNLPPMTIPVSDVWVSDYIGGDQATLTFLLSDGIEATYPQYGYNNYVYLLFTNSGLYNFHLPQSSADTVDLSRMDTANMLNFSVQPKYTVQSTSLVGIMDTTNYFRSLLLYTYFGPATGLPEIEYPTKLVQKLEFSASATYSNNGNAMYYSYADTVPPTLPFPAEPQYTITSPSYSNFTVAFNGAKPTYYVSNWSNTKINWFLYSSPDSASINPQKLLTSLNSKMLQGQDLSTMPTHTFGYGASPGLNYANWWNYSLSPDQISAKRLSTVMTFEQSF